MNQTPTPDTRSSDLTAIRQTLRMLALVAIVALMAAGYLMVKKSSDDGDARARELQHCVVAPRSARC